MPHYLRPAPLSVPVFFTLCLARAGDTALIDHLGILRQTVRTVLHDRPVDILAWVVLPDHMHAIWRLPAEDPNYSQRWGRIKATFTRDACRAGLVPPPSVTPKGCGLPTSATRKGERGVWQPRFWEHHCRDQADLDRHLKYCWSDPVRHGYVEKPADWDASSVHREVRRGVVCADWCELGGEGLFGEAA